VVAIYGRLDILVNNAGISGSSVGDHNGREGWHRIIAVNQTSVFLGTKLAAEHGGQRQHHKQHDADPRAGSGLRSAGGGADSGP
jgi:NAD(P)-dependent dehydrogenase (short-subunit alcohol dehydrogenase family)